MKKLEFPMGTGKAAKILGKCRRTIWRHLKKLRFFHTQGEKYYNTGFIIQNEKEFNQLKESIKNAKSGKKNKKNA